MDLTDLKRSVEKNPSRKRVGRGRASGTGTTAGRGHKGQFSRSGASKRAGFEGGQMPLFRRLPKRGFNNARFATVMVVVNIDTLAERFKDGDTVTVDAIREQGLVKNIRDGVKVLGRGELDKKLNVEVHRISKAARAAIEAKGGTAKELAPANVAQRREEKAARKKKREEKRASKR